MKTLIFITTILLTLTIQGQNKMAQEGDAEEQYKYAQKVYTSSSGTDKEAYEWFMKSALQGHSEAQRQLGTMYHRGDHVANNEEKALYWYDLGAKNGDFYAAEFAANYYYFGHSVKKDEAKAVTLWIYAIENYKRYADVKILYHRLNEVVIHKYVEKNTTPDIIKMNLTNAKITAPLTVAFALANLSY